MLDEWGYCVMYADWCVYDAGSYKLIYIGPFRIAGEACQTDLGDIRNDLESYYDEFFKRILKENEPFENFDIIPVCPNKSTYYYRMTHGGCMSEWQQIGEFEWELSSCIDDLNNPLYCHEYIEICREKVDGEYEIKLTKTGPQPAIQCPVLEPPFGECVPICDY
jgi:hypothetical protein